MSLLVKLRMVPLNVMSDAIAKIKPYNKHWYIKTKVEV